MNISQSEYPTRLSRRLNTKDAVLIGLGSMIGAGIFVAAGPASAVAGSGVVIGVLIAGLIAYLNAMSMAQLAALYPESGGAYIYGQKQIGRVSGFLAGWGFVIGKLASCAAMALTFAFYAAPEHAKPLAITSVFILSLVNSLGVKKTAFVTNILVLVTLLSLGIVVFASMSGGGAEFSRLKAGMDRGGIAGVLQSAGIIFFAFAGYARIATLGEEVIHPQTTIPRALLIGLSLTLFIYVIVMMVTLICVDSEVLANSQTPLVLAVQSGAYSFLAPAVRVGACFASLGVLLSLMAGISRTTFAMAANRDIPHWLSKVHPISKVPHRAELVVGLIIALIVGVTDLRSAIGFSSFAILAYYFIANISAWTLKPEHRRFPRWMSAAGALSCFVVAFSLPLASIIGGIMLFGLGLLVYLFANNRRQLTKLKSTPKSNTFNT